MEQEFLLLICLLLLLLLLQLHRFGAAGAAAAGVTAQNSSFLQLSAGLDLRMSTAFDVESGYPLSLDRMFSVATPTLDEGGLFFPILSSPSFLNSTSSATSDPSTSDSLIIDHRTATSPAAQLVSVSRRNISTTSLPFGFSLGFYLIPSQFDDDTRHPCLSKGCTLFLAVCAGSFGSKPDVADPSESTVSLAGALKATGENPYSPYKTVDGFATPVWVANPERPIHYADTASLFVTPAVTHSNGSAAQLELQLKDGNEVVWRVDDVDTMEVQVTGHLLIRSASSNTSVWQSSRTDTLVQGQHLEAGQELISNDSSYVARMEKGGLVFYMNRTHFNREMQPPPYWLFPVHRSDSESAYFDTNRMIFMAPCSNSPAFAEVVTPGYTGYGLAVDAGSCSSASPYIVIPEYNSAMAEDISWIFWRLENDGMLYSYAVVMPSGSAALVTRKPVDVYAYNSNITFCCPRIPQPLFLQWRECNVPMACGPLGVCTPGSKPYCACPDTEFFEPVDKLDIFQGCKRTIDLPDSCASTSVEKGHTGSMDFLRLNSTASVLLFNKWTFDSPPDADVNACKQLCSSDCSCNGFFYQVNTSSCFFITDGITLLTVNDSLFQDQTSDLHSDAFVARDYVTFLKIKSADSSTGDSDGAPLQKKNHKAASHRRITALSASGAAIILVCSVLLGSFMARRKKLYAARKSMLAREAQELQGILPLHPTRFSYKDLHVATKGFSKLLGAGGCGSVYSGVLSDGRKVAVKVLQIALQDSDQFSKQFLAEIATVGRTAHYNIVHLVGFCWEVSRRLLVYEYVERGSLDRWIYAEDMAETNPADDSSATSAAAAPFLDWGTRYNVALGIVRGLSYLHEDCNPPILHFDIKPQNILLDDEFVPKLSDFGMSRLIKRNESSVVTVLRGTPGYIDPEWCSHGRVSKKSDVYSMGMVLLEIVGGRKNLNFRLLNSSCDPVEKEAWHFPTWAARKCEQGLMMEVVDRRLHDAAACGFDAAQARRLICSAFWCIQEDPTMRPNAPTVVQWLEGSCTVEQPPFLITLNAKREPLVAQVQLEDSATMLTAGTG